MSEADDLERIKRVLDTLYELGETCIHPDTGDVVSDPEYDRMVKRLAEIRPDSKELKGFSSSQVDSPARKVRHNPPMASLNKAIGSLAERTKTLTDWLSKCGVQEFTQAYKWDGIAVAIYYEKGKLVRAGLRPNPKSNGLDGEDVTANIKYVEGVKETLPLLITCSIRGEIVCKKDVFARKNRELEKNGEKTFANERNYAAGSIRQFVDPTITKDRELSFCAYSIWGLENPPYKDEISRAKWCAKTLGVPFVQVRPFKQEDLKLMEENVPNLNYEVDGIVISVADLEDQEQLGTHGDTATGNPRGKIAWKFAEEAAEAIVDTVEWNVGRTGTLTPVLNFKSPIQLAGTKVSCCTGHNLGYLRLNKIGKNTKIEVIKSGKIIPKVLKVLSGQTDPELPKVCPSCRHDLEVRAGGEPGKEALFCSNDFCGERAVAKLCHYLQTFGVKGLSDVIVTKLYYSKMVKHPADFYRLQVVDLIKSDGEDPHSTKKEFRSQFLVVARIHMVDAPDKIKDKKTLSDAIELASKSKKQVPLWQFIASLGIPGIGKSAAQALESHFRDLNRIIHATSDDFTSVEGFGLTTAEAAQSFFKSNNSIVMDLLNYVTPVLPKTGKLTGKSFVFTGSFPEGKDYWIKKVEESGGKVGGSVSKRTNFLVVGTDAGSKEAKADELGVPKLNIEELKKCLK